ncbi:uncharacterized protein LOC142333907 isoform X1 [Lycorma delicatula]|uniref:uncharacterized protein LOC142333907 isoform X1 n=1 Tax=Lycorma delicatula TaxID=130591 RepID=UPI003F51A15C
MFHIKLVSIILLCVVYYNEATDQFAIDKRDWETYYLMATSKISDFFYGSYFHHTKASCYLCILAEINKQLHLINILSNKDDKIETVYKFKSDMELFKARFHDWKNSCDKGMPTDTRKTFFEIYTTANYKASLQKNTPINVEECMSLFTRTQFSIIEFDKINQRYQDDYLSQVIFQRHFAANDLNKKCMSCIQNFVEFELKRWKEIEPTVRYYMTPDNMITGEKHWNKMRDIFINYQRYIDAVKTWITTCSSIIIDGHVDDFPSKIKDQEKNPLISKGISEKMEECIYHYSGKKRNRNLLASTGKIVNADNQLESKPSVLIQQITY